MGHDLHARHEFDAVDYSPGWEESPNSVAVAVLREALCRPYPVKHDDAGVSVLSVSMCTRAQMASNSEACACYGRLLLSHANKAKRDPTQSIVLSMLEFS